MKLLLLLFLLINISFANSENISRMNALKKVIQKEEYIALAINKYILQTADIPKTSSNKLDWTKLEVPDYLGSNFNRINPLTLKEMNVYYNTSTHTFFIRGVVDDIEDPKFLFDQDLSYLYNFYTSRIFRINTLAPIDNTESKLLKGSQIIYADIQKEIVRTLNLLSPNVNTIKMDSQKCTVGSYYYELKGRKLTYKYCDSDSSIEVYQETPIYVENIDDLEYIKVKIGDTAYAKDNGIWYEYYYQGDTNPPWIPKYLGSTLIQEEEETQDIESLINSYIPGSKDLLFRQDGGCMLANGDIFCWGNNANSKVGIENFGQLDTSLSPDHINTPVMLKVQIKDSDRNIKKWYNNPYRVKFDKMSINSSNVCGLSPVFKDGINIVGGDLYCNGSVHSDYFEDVSDGVTTTSILKKNKFISNNNLHLIDIALVEDAGLLLTEDGDLYTFGKNYSGILGVGKDDSFFVNNNPTKIEGIDTKFSKIFGLRDIRTFGAIDVNNNFWIWGNRKNGGSFNKPTKLDTSKTFDGNAIFVNTEEFILKEYKKDNPNFIGDFYQTTDDDSIINISSKIPSNAKSASIFGNSYVYINESLELKGDNSLLECRTPDDAICETTGALIFEKSFNKLNDKTNINNGKKFASFSNIGIFKLDRVLEEQYEDFESGTSSWTTTNNYSHSSTNGLISEIPFDTTDSNGQVAATNFLGRFPTAVSDSVKYYEVSKDYNFGSQYKNYEIEIEFDFYEIDTWDGEKFEVFANDEILAEDHFIFDWHFSLSDTNITGVSLQDNINTRTGYAGDQTYRYKLRAKLDSSGTVNLKFRSSFEYDLPYANYYSNRYDVGSYNEDVENESWGIDNIRIKVKETNKKFVCAMTGFDGKSQMYCWGNVARSIPLLSTSLYDMDKINTINKLFISENTNRNTPMAYDEFNNEGSLYLKFPTYIGGFDYEFYFK